MRAKLTRFDAATGLAEIREGGESLLRFDLGTDAMQSNFQRHVLALNAQAGVENSITIQYTTGSCLRRIESGFNAFRHVLHWVGSTLLEGRKMRKSFRENS